MWARVQTHYAPRPIAGEYVFTAAVLQGITAGVFRATDGTDTPVDAERLATIAGIQLMRPEKPVAKTKHILTIQIPAFSGNGLLEVVQAVTTRW